MRLDALYDFGLIVRSGGLGAASRATGRSKSTLSRRVFELEDDLGVVLFERTSGKMRLTEPGKVLFAGSRNAIGVLERVMKDVAVGFGDAAEPACLEARRSAGVEPHGATMSAGS